MGKRAYGASIRGLRSRRRIADNIETKCRMDAARLLSTSQSSTSDSLKSLSEVDEKMFGDLVAIRVVTRNAHEMDAWGGKH